MLRVSQFSKIKRIDELASIVGALKTQGRIVVQAHGDFDLVHPGHIHYFEQAKKLGDVLIVSLPEDRFIQKGPGRPIFDETTRSHFLAALEIIDYVVFCGDVGPYEVLQKIKPHFYVKGVSSKPLLKDSESGLSKDKRICDSIGTKMCFTNELPIHSVQIFEKIIKFFP